MLHEVFGDQRVEDLDRSFYAVSADLRTQSTVIHRAGPLRFAIEASICLPVIAPPRVVGRQLLVDGSLLDNLPVEAMAATGEGPVLAVDIKARQHGGGAPSNGRPARVSKRPPPLMNTLGRVLLLASANTSAQAARYADRLISVPVGAVGLLEWHQIDAAIEAGVAAARAALDEHGADLGLASTNGRA
jgi:predicted acylesterase/phospholipase RssA